MQSISLFHLFISKIQSILKSMTRFTTPTFVYAHPKKLLSAFNFCESESTCKELVIPSVHSSDTVSFRVPSPDWPNPFLKMRISKIFSRFFACVKLYQHAKNHLIPSVLSSDTVNFRVLPLDWPHSFLNMLISKT